MSAPGFSRDAVPSMRESEHLASDAYWRDLRNRYVTRLLIGAGVVVIVVLPVAIWLINGREFA